MRHRKRSRRLVTKWEHRKALIRNLLVALFVHERIKTTEAKAKELRRWADKMITLAKRGDLHARRQALSILPNKAVVRKLFSDLRERYLDRESGFTRIVRLGPRRGDAAMMVFIELVTDKLEHKRSPKKAKEEAEAQTMAPKAEPEASATEETRPAESQAEGTEGPEAAASPKEVSEVETSPEASSEAQASAPETEESTEEKTEEAPSASEGQREAEKKE